MLKNNIKSAKYFSQNSESSGLDSSSDLDSSSCSSSGSSNSDSSSGSSGSLVLRVLRQKRKILNMKYLRMII
jgi:hypothetical protein